MYGKKTVWLIRSSLCLEPTQEGSARKELHSGRLPPYPETLDKAGEACQGQTIQLINTIHT